MKNIVILVLALAIAGFGCSQRKSGRLEGEVIKISGTLPSLVASSGALFGNESVRIGNQSLVYIVRANNGDVFTINIVEGLKVSRTTLVARVCLGTKISFPVIFVVAKPDGSEKQDPNYHVGDANSDNILVPIPCL